MRLDRMQAYRDQLATISDGVNKGEAISGEVGPSNDLLRSIDRANASCIRVLECANTTPIKDAVAACARNMSVLVNRLGNDMGRDQHHLADIIKSKAVALMGVASSVSDIANQIEEAYKAQRVVLAQTGPRIDSEEVENDGVTESPTPSSAG